MMHSKVSFVRMAFQRLQKYNFTHFAWVDFGLSHDRKNFLPRQMCWDKLADGKIHLSTDLQGPEAMKRANVTDEMIKQTIDNVSPMHGCSWLLPSELVLWYERVYTKMYLR